MQNGRKQQTSFIDAGGKLYELVGKKDSPAQFLEYDRISRQFTLIDELNFNGATYVVPQNDLVANGTIKLPVYPSEYGDELSLFEAVRHFIGKYVDVPERFLTIAALYVLLSWTYDSFDAIPYLRLRGEFGTGKSRFLVVVGSLCYKACFAGGASSVSPIFRIIELYKGVSLIFDEADFTFSGPESEMIKILNCGYMKDMPVLRTEGEGSNRYPASFNVFGPKIIATRKPFADTALESRCLTQVMAGKPRKDIPRHLPKTFEEDALEVRNKLLLFRLQNYGEMTVDLSLEDYNLDPRVNQIALPLLTVIKDEAVRKEVSSHLAELQGSLNDQKRDQEPALIVEAVIEILKERKPTTYGNVAERINALAGLDAMANMMISTSRIGRINKELLGLEHRAINGVTQFSPTKQNIEKVQQLAEQYHVPVDDVDLVALYYPDAKEELKEVTLEEVKNTLL